MATVLVQGSGNGFNATRSFCSTTWSGGDHRQDGGASPRSELQTVVGTKSTTAPVQAHARHGASVLPSHHALAELQQVAALKNK